MRDLMGFIGFGFIFIGAAKDSVGIIVLGIAVLVWAIGLKK
jgi:hypothetical protein